MNAMGTVLALELVQARESVDVAAELRIAKSTMTGMVARMRDAGLIQLEGAQSD